MQARRPTLVLALVLALFVPSQAAAQTGGVPTEVVVRAVSQDAKVLQDPVGGARVTIRDMRTGEVLAEGLQRGGSGDTERIMRRPRQRGDDVYATPNAAAFRDTLYLTEPTPVEITAEGPMAYPQAVQRASKTMLLVPGQPVGGGGVVLTIHGFIVEIQEPAGVDEVAGDSLDVRARVRMTCGCPTQPGGLWDADDYEITARLVDGDEVIAEAPMRYAGASSTYEARLPSPDAGTTELQVLAVDADAVNFGMDRRALSK